MNLILQKIKSVTLLSTFCLSIVGNSYAQLSGSKTVGVTGDYTSFTGSTGLFHAINTSGLNGDLTVTVISDIVEPTAIDSLKDFTAGGDNNYRLTIKPSAAIQRNITGTSAAFMMTFYGVRNLTVDGSFAGSGNYLRFSNDNSGLNAGTMRYLNGCTTDSVVNCILESSNGVTIPGNFTTQKGGTVVLDATVGVVTNSNLVFKNNIFRDITGSTNGYPGCLLRAVDNDPYTNTNITVANNQFVNARIESIRTGTNASVNTLTGWTITGNSIYATTNTSTAAATAKSGIILSRAVGHVVTNNFIGGNAAGATGTYPLSVSFTGIATTTANATSPLVSNNTVANITGNFATPTAGSGALIGISATWSGGLIINNIVKNISSNGCDVTGLKVTGSTDTAINNTIQNLRSTFNNTTTNNAKNTVGIFAGTGYHYIANNTIDSIVGNSSYYQFAAAPCGIYVNSIGAGGAMVLDNNSITNIGNVNNTASAYHSASVGGIIVSNSGSSNSSSSLIVKNNYIANIYGVNTSANGNNIVGILDFSGTATVVYPSTYTNNVIVLGSNAGLIPASGWLSGIQLASPYASPYTITNNTISISSGINLNSTIDSANRGGAACIVRLNNLPIINLQNNVLSNLAQNTGNGAIAALNFMTDNAGGVISSNYNVYNTPNANTVIADAGSNYSLSGWKTLKSIDSMTTVASLIPFTSNSDLHINTTDPAAWNVFGRGIASASVVTDKDGNTRSTTVGIPTTVGAYEIPMPSSTPADMTIINGTPTVGIPTELWSNGRKIAEINWTSITAVPSSFSAKFYPGVAAPFLDYAPKTNAYFDINETGFVGSYTIKQYVNAAEGAGQAFSSLRAAKRHGTDPYTFIANAGSNSVDANGTYLQSTAQTTFSSFGMTSGTTPLMIQLKDISAYNNKNVNIIHWSTVADTKDDVYDLETSTDSKTFAVIANIKATGKGGNYNYTHTNPTEGNNYYRLHLRNKEGNDYYSKVVNAFVAGDDNWNVNIYPNPLSDKLNIVSDGFNESYALQIIDITGKVVYAATVKDAVTTVNISFLKAGNYFVKVSQNDIFKTFKITKD